jgi:hypothetical protein
MKAASMLNRHMVKTRRTWLRRPDATHGPALTVLATRLTGVLG